MLAFELGWSFLADAVGLCRKALYSYICAKCATVVDYLENMGVPFHSNKLNGNAQFVILIQKMIYLWERISI